MNTQSLEHYWIGESATMEEAISAIQKNNSRCVVVVGEDEKVIGVFSEGDILRAILAGVDVHTPLQNLVKPSFYYLQTRNLSLAREWLISGITLIPVINRDFKLQSVITLEDIFGGANNE